MHRAKLLRANLLSAIPNDDANGRAVLRLRFATAGSGGAQGATRAARPDPLRAYPSFVESGVGAFVSAPDVLLLIHESRVAFIGIETGIDIPAIDRMLRAEWYPYSVAQFAT